MAVKVAEEEKFRPVKYGNYLLLDRINVGGMAEVFRAKSRGLAGVERLVAIKRILPHLAKDPEFTNMFIDEARIAIHLHHANIAQLYELGKVDDSLFIAMEYIHGRDLRALINRMRYLGRSIPLPLVVYVISKVCEGLHYAHCKRDDIAMRDLNIVHRDVSPQNIIISSDGNIKIIDFGIAKASAKENHTRVGILKGKFGYMAPEQVIGEEIDRRADIFCAGILAYELLTTERLFAGSSELSTLRRIRRSSIVPPSTINVHVPREMEEIVLKALARDPDDRYATASALEEDLQQMMRDRNEAPFTPRQLSSFMEDVFGKDLAEDRQRLEIILKKAAELQAEEDQNDSHGESQTVVDLDALAKADQSPEDITNSLRRHSSPPHGEQQGEHNFQDTPSPFAGNQGPLKEAKNPNYLAMLMAEAGVSGPITPPPATSEEKDWSRPSDSPDPYAWDDENEDTDPLQKPWKQGKPAPEQAPWDQPRPAPNAFLSASSDIIPVEVKDYHSGENQSPLTPLPPSSPLYIDPHPVSSSPSLKNRKKKRKRKRRKTWLVLMWLVLGTLFLLMLYFLFIVPAPSIEPLPPPSKSQKTSSDSKQPLFSTDKKK